MGLRLSFLCAIFEEGTWNKIEKACSMLIALLMLPWQAHLLALSSWSPIHCFTHGFYCNRTSPHLSLLFILPAFVCTVHWLTSVLSIVRISCSFSWHGFLSETFPSLVQAKELLPQGEGWSADWKHAWSLVCIWLLCSRLRLGEIGEGASPGFEVVLTSVSY